MEVWTLFFLVTFLNGNQLMFQNNKQFETEAECLAVGDQKDDMIMSNILIATGASTLVQFKCHVSGVSA